MFVGAVFQQFVGFFQKFIVPMVSVLAWMAVKLIYLMPVLLLEVASGFFSGLLPLAWYGFSASSPVELNGLHSDGLSGHDMAQESIVPQLEDLDHSQHGSSYEYHMHTHLGDAMAPQLTMLSLALLRARRPLMDA